jgi:hypothetical protein
MSAEMRRAKRMCATCPFRLPLTKAERQELAAIEPEGFPCHTEQGYDSWSDIECRGHWEARRQFALFAVEAGLRADG